MSMREHKKDAPSKINIGIISVSSSRSIEDDKSGLWISKKAAKEGHQVVFHRVVLDEISLIARTVRDGIRQYQAQAIILTGGTGLSQKDVTIEAVRPLFDKELKAFSTIFAQLSYEQIDSGAILSRATAGTVRDTIVFCIPGSLKACKLACGYLIFPEVGHILRHMTKG